MVVLWGLPAVIGQSKCSKVVKCRDGVSRASQETSFHSFGGLPLLSILENNASGGSRAILLLLSAVIGT